MNDMIIRVMIPKRALAESALRNLDFARKLSEKLHGGFTLAAAPA